MARLTHSLLHAIGATRLKDGTLLFTESLAVIDVTRRSARYHFVLHRPTTHSYPARPSLLYVPVFKSTT